MCKLFVFIQRNGTIYEDFTIMTGMDDPANYGQIVEWNGLKYMSQQFLKKTF